MSDKGIAFELGANSATKALAHKLDERASKFFIEGRDETAFALRDVAREYHLAADVKREELDERLKVV